jgi:hypothetical protein
VHHKCRLHAKVRIPSGWQYALSSTDFRGFVFLEPGLSAEQSASYHMSGESPETTKVATWSGPTEEDYNLRDVGDAAPVYWSRCGKGKNLMITTEVSMTNHGNPASTGYLVADTIDGEIFHLLWRRC